jgi:hypothetical protein
LIGSQIFATSGSETVVDLPVVYGHRVNGYWAASESVHYVVSEGLQLHFLIQGAPNGCIHDVFLGGYLQPAS